MGHERVGMLPRTKKWGQVVFEMSFPGISGDEIDDIAKRTLKNVRMRYGRIMYDNGVKAAFQFLVYVAVASRQKEPHKELQRLGIDIAENFTPLSLTSAAHKWVSIQQQSLEYARIAKYAAGDAIVQWHANHIPVQAKLFDFSDDPFELWREAGNGAGFCELSRLFFAKFTERYLNYFLEREASATFPSLNGRNQFSQDLKKHIDNISQHAFETSKITQSFAAGWFNKNARTDIPSDESILGFLAHAFEKMSEELLREERGL